MDRLIEALELVENELTPEAKKLIDTIEYIRAAVDYLDYNDWLEWKDDDSEYGLENFIRKLLKDYLKKEGEKK